MKELLDKRIGMMQNGRVGAGVTDQFRVYSHIIYCIEHGHFLRLMVQASAGTGKSFLLNTVYLYCLVHEKRCKAAAPTGIAASTVGDRNVAPPFMNITQPRRVLLEAVQYFSAQQEH